MTALELVRGTCPPDHKHGQTGTCYVNHRCGCSDCREGRTRYAREHGREVLYGRYETPYVPIEPVREHFEMLQAFGMGWKRIAEVAGIGYTAASQIIYGRKGSGADARKGVPLKRISRVTAEKVLAVKPALENLRPGALVSSRGVRRRVQALVTRGWSQSKIAVRLGIPRCSLTRVMTTHGPCMLRLHLAAAALYDELWDVEPPHAEWREKIAYNRTLKYAAERRWLPPLAWDDIDTDVTPPVPDAEAGAIDEMAVQLACSGESVRLSPAERREAVTRLVDAKLSDGSIAERLGCADRTVLRIRIELGLAAPIGYDHQVRTA